MHCFVHVTISVFIMLQSGGGPGLGNVPSSPSHVSLGNNNISRVATGGGDNAGTSPGITNRSSPDLADSTVNAPTSVV